MNTRDYFVMAAKILGIYSILSSVPYVAIGIQFASVPESALGSYRSLYLISQIVAWATPIALIFLGIFLLRDNHVIFGIAYPDEVAPSVSNNEDLFLLLIKLLGLFLIIDSFPDFLKTLSDWLIMVLLPKMAALFLGTRPRLDQVLMNFVPLALGAYLFRNGRFVANIGLGKRP